MTKHIIIAGLLTAGLFFSACTATNPRYAQIAADKGRSFETARFSQILNPEAGVSDMPIEGIDGQAADDTYKKYQDTFKVETPPTPVFNLNIGPGGK